MKRKILLTAITGVVSLASISQAVMADGFSRYEKYFVDKDTSKRWSIPSASEEVGGSQNFWFATARDVRKGKFNISIKSISDLNPKSFLLVPQSSWGEFKYKVTALTPIGEDVDKIPKWSSVSSRNVSWNTLNKAKGTYIVGKVKEVLPNGKGFIADISFKNGPQPARFEVIEEKVDKYKRYPDVYSRQYGPHWLHTFDVYYPEHYKPGESKPLPTIFYVHGGGWCAFNKVCNKPKSWNENGYAYISISYRYVSMYKQHPEMNVPVAAPLLDAARALQYIKYNAKELGLDPNRICVTGGSAGGATTAWLAMVDDLANPDSSDPISRVSTRVKCAIPVQAQTSLDPIQMRKWIPQIAYGQGAFFDRATDKDFNKLKSRQECFQYFVDNREKILPAIKDFSAYEFASKDDPPMLLDYSGQKDEDPGDTTHHPKFGEHMYKRLQELGVKSWYVCKNVKEYGGDYTGWSRELKFLKDHLLPIDQE